MLPVGMVMVIVFAVGFCCVAQYLASSLFPLDNSQAEVNNQFNEKTLICIKRCLVCQLRVPISEESSYRVVLNVCVAYGTTIKVHAGWHDGAGPAQWKDRRPP